MRSATSKTHSKANEAATPTNGNGLYLIIGALVVVMGGAATCTIRNVSKPWASTSASAGAASPPRRSRSAELSS